MDLDGLLNASLELEKRIKTDQILRQHLSPLLAKKDSSARHRSTRKNSDGSPGNPGSASFTLPAEMCELLDIAANATGKSQIQILEESFADYFQKHFGDGKANPA